VIGAVPFSTSSSVWIDVIDLTVPQPGRYTVHSNATFPTNAAVVEDRVSLNGQVLDCTNRVHEDLGTNVVRRTIHITPWVSYGAVLSLQVRSVNGFGLTVSACDLAAELEEIVKLETKTVRPPATERAMLFVDAADNKFKVLHPNGFVAVATEKDIRFHTSAFRDGCDHLSTMTVESSSGSQIRCSKCAAPMRSYFDYVRDGA